jgi:hypothetical protein
MSKTKWFSGPPPSVGWWPASYSKYSRIYRWWDGRVWSAPARWSQTASFAQQQAGVRGLMQDRIRWTRRPKSWPARSKT